MSSFPRNIGWPPIVATAASVETRVLVLLLLNIMATVLPVRLPKRFFGIEPDLTVCLCELALRTRVVNSAGERSAIERKWRGANGEVCGVAGLEYARFWALDREFKNVLAGRVLSFADILVVSQLSSDRKNRGVERSSDILWNPTGRASQLAWNYRNLRCAEKLYLPYLRYLTYFSLMCTSKAGQKNWQGF